MGYYICPSCGSSLDAGEKCACGSGTKPTQERKRVYLTTNSNECTPLYNKMQQMQQELEAEKEQQKTDIEKRRKEIFNTICKRTSRE